MSSNKQNVLDTIDLKQLGGKLQDARLNCGLNLEYVSRNTSISSEEISNIEKGESRIKATELIKLSRCYQVSVGDLIGAFDDLQKLTTEEQISLYQKGKISEGTLAHSLGIDRLTLRRKFLKNDS